MYAYINSRIQKASHNIAKYKERLPKCKVENVSLACNRILGRRIKKQDYKDEQLQV